MVAERDGTPSSTMQKHSSAGSRHDQNQQSAKDEVAAILNGLNLDYDFFMSKIRPTEEAAAAGLKSPQKADFDIYANEALIPVLIQSLDSLCRHLQRMKLDGDNLDPKVRERFNPLTYIAQQLLRNHPKCARTPRRMELYKNFSEWSDHERGRREILRKKDVVQQCFNGFQLRGGVQTATLTSVLQAVDDTLRLEGAVKDSRELYVGMDLLHLRPDMLNVQKALVKRGSVLIQPAADLDAAAVMDKSKFFSGEKWTFERFWKSFSATIAAGDIIPYTVLARGVELQKEEQQARIAYEEAMKAEAEARKAQEEKELREVEEYKVLFAEMHKDKDIRAILDDGKILTGDDMRPTDPGYEFEVPPQGIHCWQLHTLLGLLGFENLPELEDTNTETDEIEGWWVMEMAQAWMLIQELEGSELVDGCVEKEVLEKVLVNPENFIEYKQKVEDEIERRTSDEDPDRVSRRRPPPAAKPSMSMLSVELGMTLARLQWLHQLFVSFLQPEEGGPPVVCNYPEDPASISKAYVKKLMEEIKPGLTDAEFNARFERIDTDGSGSMEFDEFVRWVAMGEVHISAQASRHMTFKELAALYDVPLERIKYFHSMFEGQLDGDKDPYPEDPSILDKKEIKNIIKMLGIKMTNEEIDANFEMADQEGEGEIAFDQFLEVIGLDTLPDEIKLHLT